MAVCEKGDSHRLNRVIVDAGVPGPGFPLFGAGGSGLVGQTCVLDRLGCGDALPASGYTRCQGLGCSYALSGLGVAGLDTQGFTLGIVRRPFGAFLLASLTTLRFIGEVPRWWVGPLSWVLGRGFEDGGNCEQETTLECRPASGLTRCTV